jgi:DNA repair exonuclease SbcCD nuclease subunit
MTTTILVIGDTHFRKNHIKEGKEFVSKVLEKLPKIKNLNFTVLLGDILDSHERTDTTSYNLACDFIEKLSEYAKVFVLMGNHDIADQNEFLSKRHFFNPLKKWQNVTIVDSVKTTKFHSHSFVFCPYVPKGKFRDALNTNTESLWETCTCIFAHQELRGCWYNDIESEDGDMWDSDFPPLISGHIHNAQKVGDNVYYPGSSSQIKVNESADKRIWKVEFNKNSEIKIIKINLYMRFIKKITVPLEEIQNFDKNQIDSYNIVLTVTGTREEYKNFKREELYEELRKCGVVIHFSPKIIEDTKFIDKIKGSESQLSFKTIFKNLVERADKTAQLAYTDLLNKTQ